MSPFLEEKMDSREVKWHVQLAGFLLGFPGSVIKNPPANARDVGSIPGLERSLGEGNGNSFQYFFLRNPMHRGVCQATVNGVSKDYVESIHRSQRYHIIRPN